MNAQITVIVPVYNDLKALETCLLALRNQTLPQSLYQIVIIDNNSREDISQLAAERVHVLTEERQGSYISRNKGMQIFPAPIFAFTDSDCIPDKNWLSNALTAFQSDSTVDLIGGHITFVGQETSLYHLWDALYHLNNKEYIARHGYAATANLLVRKHVFDQIGYFQEWPSGADTELSGRASREGFRLVYREDVKISHTTRGKKELLIKRTRIGKGLYDKHSRNSRLWKGIYYKMFILLSPVAPLLYNLVVTKRHTGSNKILFFFKMFPISVRMSWATARGLAHRIRKRESACELANQVNLQKL